jgi:broad specificity phosphatase PhoE
MWHNWKDAFFFRHGKTHPLSNYDHDSERKLTAQGVEKTKELKGCIDRMQLKFDLLISSPVDRAVDSIGILFPGIEIVTIDELYFDTDVGQAMDALFGEHGYKSAEYYQELNPQLMAELGNRAAVQIAKEIRKHQANRVAIMSHAVICQLVASAMVGGNGPGIQPMLNVEIQEANGFRLFADGNVDYF